MAGLTELTNDQRVSGAFDPRLLLLHLVFLQADQILVADLEGTGLRLDSYTNPIEQRLRHRSALRRSRRLHLRLKSELGPVLLKQPFQPCLRKAESFQRITPERGLERCSERLLGREPRQEEKSFEKVALTRRVGSHEDHQRRELYIDIVQRFESLDAKPGQHVSPFQSRDRLDVEKLPQP